MSSDKDITMEEADDSKKKSSHSSKEKEENNSKKSHKKSDKEPTKKSKSSKSKSSKSSKSSKHSKDKDTDKSKQKSKEKSPKIKKDKSKTKDRDKTKRKRKRSFTPSHSRSSSRTPKRRRSRSRSRSRSRTRSHSRHRYSRYSRSPSYRSHRRHRRDRDRRRRRYKRRRDHSRTRSHSSHSRSPSSKHSKPNTANLTAFETKLITDIHNPNGSKATEIKATAPNAMQQPIGSTPANPLAAFNSVFGGMTRPAVLALTNPVQQTNATLQQLLSGANPYKLNMGLSGTNINPLLMNKMAAELRKSAVEQQTKIAAKTLAESKALKSSDDSLFFTVHLPGMNTLTAIGGIHPQITRPARRLYVGNLPVGMGLTEQILTEFFSQCCKGLGIATLNPVLSVWLNSEQTFGFIEFRAVQDTNLALQLFEGLQLGGRQLRFGRPVDYKEPPENLRNYVVGDGGNGNGNGSNIEAGSPAAMLVAQQSAVRENVMNGVKDGALDMAVSARQKAMLQDMISEGSESGEGCVLLLMDMLCEEDIAKEEEYEDILDDIKCECESYGELLEVVIPRAGEEGCGRVFLKYGSVGAAKKCKGKVDGRKFGDKVVKCVYFKEETFEKKEYGFKLD